MPLFGKGPLPDAIVAQCYLERIFIKAFKVALNDESLLLWQDGEQYTTSPTIHRCDVILVLHFSHFISVFFLVGNWEGAERYPPTHAQR